MSLSIGIFTTNSVDKLHPRIEMQLEVLEQAGYQVEIIRSTERREGFLSELVNLFSLKYFKWGFIRRNKKNLEKFDVVHLYDLQLLPLAKHAKKKGKRVVYETLDDNVHLNFHAVAKKLLFIKLFKTLILKRMAKYERSSAKMYCDKVIVNSANLMDNFDSSELIFYASHLESINNGVYNPTMPTAFIYIGKLTAAKGAKEYSELVDKYKIPMLFLGKAFDQDARTLADRSDVNHLGNFNSKELKAEMSELIEKFNLIGLSVIKPENKSYLLQEANKDIDYLSMGLPFIGNDRPPTFQKLKDGAGVLVSDSTGILRLINNEEGFYDYCSNNCNKIYRTYSQEAFRHALLQTYSGLTKI